MSLLGQNRKSSGRAYVFRFTPESGLKSDIPLCPFRANFGLMRLSKDKPVTRSHRSGAGDPVQLVVMLDPVGGSQVSSNVRRSVNILPRGGENHFTVIAAHERDLTNYVLGSRGAR